MNSTSAPSRQLLRAALCALALVFFTGCISWRASCFRDVTPASPQEIRGRLQARKAYALLRDAKEFTSSHVDSAGSPSCLVVAFQEVLGSRSAKMAFKRLLGEATIEGQLYALSGLYLVDPEVFAAAVPRYRAMTTRATTQFGCVVGQMPVHLIVETGAPLDPKELKTWHEENPLAEYPPVDIISGGWPLEFKNAFKF